MKSVMFVVLSICLSVFGSFQAYATPIGNVVLSRVIDISHLGGVPIGIAHDNTYDSFWLTNTTGRSGSVYATDVIQISQDGSELFRFNAPDSAFVYRAITTSSDASVIYLLGDVWDHAEVYSFSRNGDFMEKMSLIGGDLKAGSGLAIADNGDIWVSDFDGSELMRFDSNGILQDTFSLSFNPGNIALDSENNNLYIMPLSDPFIRVLNISDLTEFNISISARDTSIGLGVRMGLALSQDYIYAMDTGWKHIEIYSSTPVPEPATILLFVTGLVGVIGCNTRGKKNSKNAGHIYGSLPDRYFAGAP